MIRMVLKFIVWGHTKEGGHRKDKIFETLDEVFVYIKNESLLAEHKFGYDILIKTINVRE